MAKPLVIYHEHCADGIGAAWCFWKKYGDKMEYRGGVYGMSIEEVVGRDVYFVDFSTKRNIMAEIVDFAKSVTLLDHHVSALEDLKGLEGLDMSHCTTEKSGAMIAWDYLNPGKTAPRLIQHVQDRDLWKFEIAGTREITAWLFAHGLELPVFDVAVDTIESVLRPTAIAQGSVLLMKERRDIDSIIATCKRYASFEGVRVPIANASGMFASDVGNILARGEPFAATYYDTEDGRKWSLRSEKGGMDVYLIALRHGGGGHKNAAGFFVPNKHPLSNL